MTSRFRFPIARDVHCPVFDHMKDVRVCKAQPYAPCKGCEVRRLDRERFGGRLFRIVESTSDPGAAHTSEVIRQDPHQPWTKVERPVAVVDSAGLRRRRKKKKKKGDRDVLLKKRKRKKRKRKKRKRDSR